MTNAKSGRVGWRPLATGLVAWLLSSCQPGVPVWGPPYADLECRGANCERCGGKKPDPEPTIRGLAHDIDELEEQIEKFGSVVPKHADVWGQARLTMHRQEFERVMRADVYAFQPTLQATIRASDQAFLANALSLSAGTKVAGSPSAPDAMSLLATPNDAITRNDLVKTSTISNYVTSNGKLALEPTILEDQKKRYLDHLHQLRRINEGDDNTDAPGYALNLVRIPVSLLTGECTQRGYGAECTITATPHLPDDLLPETFRNLVVNDLIKLLTVPLTRIIENTSETDLHQMLEQYEDNRKRKATISSRQMADERNQEIMHSDAAKLMYGVLANIVWKGVPVSTHRVNQVPIPPSQLVSTVGAHNLAYLAQQIRLQIEDHRACKQVVYHLDVQAVLMNELGAAFEFLSSTRGQALWEYCTPVISEAIRTQDVMTLLDIQDRFFHSGIENLSSTKYITTKGGALPITRTMISILAWTIIIDSALLNQRFLEEMRATHAAKGCSCAPPGWAPLFLPHPPAEVCQLFNEFVRCRWPLHIFALDPETEDQNVGDSFSLRRELQLAMSVAFTSGQISANNFTRYVRRIEQDIDTISLNRTIVGFSHGEDTFGWRFYPRVQTPPIDGNLQAIFRDLLIGGYGPRYSLRRRRLENGIRECVALVIMPSFVPYLDLDITGNWFRLADPKCKALDLQRTMRLSAAVKSLQDASPHTCDQHCYRPVDIEMMMRRLDQLSLRLPLQKQLVNVPFENTHGGFELLSAGVTNLAPELQGWYGAPGINPNDYTSIFLVGDNFSVDQTRVIVGGLHLDPNCQADCAKARSPATCVVCTATPTPAPGGAAVGAPAPASPPDSNLPMPRQIPPRQLPALSPQTNAAPATEAGQDPEVIQAALFRRCKPQEPRPPAAPVISILNTPGTGNLPGSQAAAAGAQAAGAGAQAALAGMFATIAGNLGRTGGGNLPIPGGVIRADAKDGTPPPAAPPAVPGPQAANDGAKSAANGAGAAVAGAQTVAYSEAAIAADLTSAGLKLAYEVPHFQMELISRQVMRIVIPKGVYSNNGYVDVHVATPYGVSPHLSIPILCDTKIAAPPAYGFSVDENSKLTVYYTLTPLPAGPGGVRYSLAFVRNDPTDAVFIDWSSPTGSILNMANADLLFAFQDVKNSKPIHISNIREKDLLGKKGGGQKPKTEGGYFIIVKDQLTTLSQQLIDRLNDEYKGVPEKFQVPSQTTKNILVTLKPQNGLDTEPVSTSNQLTVQFQLAPIAPPKIDKK